MFEEGQRRMENEQCKEEMNQRHFRSRVSGERSCPSEVNVA